ncbi:VWFA and cache domain-containing protein 1-like [Argopecten irradians]|uniref:VWFA and cache domain-containing protein 1-like n=1 Tax=Argopecten irradians TaxID=31199 RepID=UPI00371131FB
MYAFLAAILLLSCGVNMCQAMDATKFANTLKDFATNGMGVDALQAHYDGLSYTTKDVDGAALISDLSSDIGETFSILTAAATNIKLAVEENYASFESDLSSGMTSCCDVRGESNLKFQSNISFTAPCWTVSPKSPVEKKFPNAAVGSVMESNYEANSNKLLWQYFGSENGTSILYPQAKVSTTSCESFDPRFRPYYATAATPMAKDIVVLVDTSPSMHNTDNTGRTRLKLAKEVATTTLQTLNPNDRFAVVTFDPNSYKPTSGCYADQLSLYTPDNERFLSKFIGHIDVTGNSDINVGLEAAFHYFQNSSAPTEDDERSQVILVLSDGADFPSTRSPLDVIRDENAKLRNRVVIMVYGLGNDLVPGTSAELMLRNISVQSRNNPAAGTTKPGFYENIDIAEAVRSKMGSYYSFFKSSSTTAVVSDPFIDTFSSIGLLISVCLPAYDKTDLDILLGVACADVKLSDLFSKAAVFNEGDLSYVFIIDSKGRTLSHPLLPLSRTVKTSYTQLDISYLERSEEAAPVIEAMKRKESGNQVVHSSTRTMARGVVLNEGIITRKVKSTYYYAPVSIK